jgi:hypothetical protein
VITILIRKQVFLTCHVRAVFGKKFIKTELFTVFLHGFIRMEKL